MIEASRKKGCDRANEETAQSGMVWAGRTGWLSLPQLDEEPGLAPRPVRGQACDRDLQHLVGADAVQRALPRAGGIRETRGVGGGRLSPGVSGDVAGRDPASADGHALPQPGQ